MSVESELSEAKKEIARLRELLEASQNRWCELMLEVFVRDSEHRAIYERRGREAILQAELEYSRKLLAKDDAEDEEAE